MKIIHLLLIALAALQASCSDHAANQTATAPAAAPSSAAPDPAAMSFLPDAIRAFGTEPFWSAQIADGKLTYLTPATQASGGLSVPVQRADGAASVQFTAMVGGDALQILVTPGECSDGMSDNSYPWTVERTLGEDVVEGCAEPARP